jgi:uncharacterized protein YabE (DUF348 family)
VSLLERAGAPMEHVPVPPPESATGDVLPRHAVSSRGPARRAWPVAIGIVVALGLLGALLAVAHRASATGRVQLTVDGLPATVAVDGGTVADVLRTQGISVTTADVVSPAPSTPIAEAASIVVGYARPVELTVDGTTRELSTTAPTVGRLLADLGLPAASFTSEPALLPLPRTGTKLTVRTPKAVTVRVDGRSVPLLTTAATVGQVVAGKAVGYRSRDLLSVPARTPVVAGSSYRVTRVQVTDRRQRLVRPAPTQWVRRADIPTGTTQVVSTGHDGIRERRVRVEYRDGRVVSRTVRFDRVRSTPMTWVIAVGTGASAEHSSGAHITYERDWTPATGKADGQPDFAALAKCESGGNPRALNPSGKYRGLYQFDLTTWRGVGGVGDPIDASPAEQTRRARILYNDRGRSPWPYCGRYL